MPRTEKQKEWAKKNKEHVKAYSLNYQREKYSSMCVAMKYMAMGKIKIYLSRINKGFSPYVQKCFERDMETYYSSHPKEKAEDEAKLKEMELLAEYDD